MVARAHQLLAEVLGEGDRAIDATVGNGHDTLFLAERVGESGRVYGFDIQAAAIDAAWARLDAAGLADRVSLQQAGHEAMSVVLDGSLQGQVRAVVFNLGYLPGGDKGRTTAAATTIAALQQALTFLAPGGLISILAYVGHPGGMAEAEQVKAWAAGLTPTRWQVTVETVPGRPAAPQLFTVRALA